MNIPRHILWSKPTLDLNDPYQRLWYIKQVLEYGRAEDVAQLDWDEVRSLLGAMSLRADVQALWHKYFDAKK